LTKKGILASFIDSMQHFDLPPIHGKRDFKNNSFVSVDQLNQLGIEHIMTRAGNIKKNPLKYNKLAKGKLLYSLFFKSSTRTRFSTETAWMRLGGTTINLLGTSDSSISKGETMEHTLKMFGGYEPEFVAIRTDEEYVAHKGREMFPDISWINCGDGNNEHPTQAMLDIFTLFEKFDDLSKLKIAFVGDIRHGRTIKSLAKVLNIWGTKMTFVAPESLHNKEEFDELGISYDQRDITELNKIVNEVDVVYATRPQLERMSDFDKKLYSKGVYQITPEIMKDSKALIMHPLPIDSSMLPEINPELDSDPRSIYFEQAANGLWVRMSLFSLLMGI
jgi:aspartate carbamoyltransferase catalytic subunit